MTLEQIDKYKEENKIINRKTKGVMSSLPVIFFLKEDGTKAMEALYHNMFTALQVNFNSTAPDTPKGYEVHFFTQFMFATFYESYTENILRTIDKGGFDYLKKEVSKGLFMLQGKKLFNSKLEQGIRGTTICEYQKTLELLNNIRPISIDKINPPRFVLPASSSVTIKIISTQIETVYEMLREYFPESHRQELRELLETGSKTGAEKLLFQSNANQLADFFKRIYLKKWIISAQKKDLIEWIILNFCFLNNGVIAEFKNTTVEKTISGNDFICKNPIIIK